MNKCFFIGNLCRDPEQQATQGGTIVCKMSLAVNRRKPANGGAQQTDFLSIKAFNKTAENALKWLKKGSKVAIVGSLETYSYQGKDGTKKYGFDIVVQDIEYLSSAGGTNRQSLAASPAKSTDTGFQELDEDELPF